jgi:hypothetical protein
MLFTLEALPAREGDALLLHFGSPKNPQLVVIDGGPGEVYEDVLAPRLKSLKVSRCKSGGPLPIRLLMVSHIDDDHIIGVRKILAEVDDDRRDGRPRTYRIASLWLNSFDDIMGSNHERFLRQFQGAMRAAGYGQGGRSKGRSELILASVPNGRKVRVLAQENTTPLNPELPDPGAAGHPEFHERLVLASAGQPNIIDMKNGLSFTVLGPRWEQVAELRETWAEKSLEEFKKKHPDIDPADYADKSVYNLSSIIVLATAGGKSILLTGDARGDVIIEGLSLAHRLGPGGHVHVDILKLPHHGGRHNVTQDFFRTVTADDYVISTNGKNKCPAIDTLDWLTTARREVLSDRDYRVHITTRVEEQDKKTKAIGKAVQFLSERRSGGCRCECILRPKEAPSIKIDLLDPLNC